MNRNETLDDVKKMAQSIPFPIYWFDLKGGLLGATQKALEIIGKEKHQDLIDKKLHDYLPSNISEKITQYPFGVNRKKEMTLNEEPINNLMTGELSYFNVTISPLEDNTKNIIGTVVVLSDVTEYKLKIENNHKGNIFEYLKIIAPVIPANMYWLNLDNRILGINQRTIEAIGGDKVDDFIGKTPHDYYPKDIADEIVKHFNEVIELGEPQRYKEVIRDLKTGKIKYFDAVISPLRDGSNNIVGTIGTTVDNTSEKEAERLRLENISQKIEMQDKFLKIANQLAHDIRSPLTSLLMIVKSCNEIPEVDRIALREAAINIGDIANNLLTKYEKKDPEAQTTEEQRQSVLISALLMQLLTNKKYQYHHLPVKLVSDFDAISNFSFIKIAPSAFKRSISNLVNNAVEATSGVENGQVAVGLWANAEWVEIAVKDNGKGMDADLVDKIKQKVSVTSGKECGHGIGLMQVHDTLQQYQGELAIASKKGFGTTITLKFPRISAPHWIAEDIKLGERDIVVILDDDISIHSAWDAIFESLLMQAPQMTLKHFQIASEVLAYIQTLVPEERRKLFLLSDYELVNQKLNGLDVVEKSEIKRSILVTSHYADPNVRDHAAKLGTKILPKQLASEVSISIDKNVIYGDDCLHEEPIDLVIVDDDDRFVEHLQMFVWPEKNVKHYHDPRHFLQELASFGKETCIVLDNQFTSGELQGLELAQQLHEDGFRCLYLLSGETFEVAALPDYITAIKKDDLERIACLGD